MKIFRLQRAQEERTRRNPTRHFDESNPSLSSYPQPTDQTVYSYNNLTYYLNPLGYNLSNLPNQQTLIASAYPNEQMNVCCGGYTYSSTNENGDKGENLLNENNKRRNSNQRHRWKINDMCLARWNEDGEVKQRVFY